MLAVPLKQLSFLHCHLVVVRGLFENRDKTNQFINFSNFEIMKKYLFIVAAAAMFAACSSDDTLVSQSTDQQVNAGEAPVEFGAYLDRGTTRAGRVGELTNTNIKYNPTSNGGGFGVFGYYTNSSAYDQQMLPNFFYNQLVYYGANGYWEYTPLKYWPNEYGSSAISDDQDKISFFAYAPYVLVSPTTGKVVNANGSGFDQEESAALQKWGIVGMTSNSVAGDPLVKYIASFDQSKSVDLCWGVCDNTDVSWQKVVNGNVQTMKAGFPWIDVERPADPTNLGAATGQKVKFTFKHATAQLMVNIDAFVDGVDNTNAVDGKTKVYVRSITFEGFAMKGSLNLNNTEAGASKAYWMDWNGNSDIVTGETVTVYDGRKDGKEGTPSGEATNEKSLGLNPALIQVGAATNAGVTKDSQPMFCYGSAAASKPIYVIPTGDPVTVTITYDIETQDENLATYISDVTTHGSSVENVITKQISFGSDAGSNKMENGKSYTINLHVGMNSVKFDAAVTDWVETAAIDVDVPANVPAFAATNTLYSVTVPATLTSYQFAVTGLNGGEGVTKVITDNVTGLTENPANASGVAIETATLSPNMTVKKVVGGAIKNVAQITGNASGMMAKLTFTQEAHALELGANAFNVSSDANTIELTTTATGIGSDWLTTDGSIVVKKNGTVLTKDSGTANGYSFDTTNGQINLVQDAVVGDVFEITLKTGDAPQETISVKAK